MEKKRYEEARKRVKAKKKFFEHLSTYLGMATFFFFLNMFTGGYLWFYWPMLGWGIGVLFHYIGVFGIPGIGELDENWERRQMKRELERLDAPIVEEDILDLEEFEQVKEKKPEKRWRDEDLV